MKKFLLLILLVLINISLFASSLQREASPASVTVGSSYFVGELGAQWTLGSDHLPVGGRIGSIHFGIWNILDRSALHYIESNTQGLRDSAILLNNIPMDNNRLSLRESIILDQIFQMLHHSSHPRSLLALQETSADVYEELQKQLPENLQLIPDSVEDLKHGDVFVYDTSIFEFVDIQCAHYKITPREDGNTYMTLTLREKNTQRIYRFVQSHVPGGPDERSLPARVELADAVIGDYDLEAITIVIGDMNRPPQELIDLFEVAALRHGLVEQPFEILLPPYATHVNTHLEASWIDNILIAIPLHEKGEVSYEAAQDASELFPELQETLELLKSKM